VTFNDTDTYDYFRDSLVDVEDTDHDRTDYDAAKDLILDMDKEYQGVLYQNERADSYEQAHGLSENMAEIPDGAPEDATDLVREFY